ncbi:MAG TPA: TerC/Alx family metal homeostasis membrane protein [Mycobacteriales bacterium]|nr:TerC/Alx family metal homeostasis membrane protein [Mycobacteriales bacterium]
MNGTFLAYAAFVAFVVVCLVVDLKVLHRGTERVGLRAAALTTAVWVGIAVLFGVGVFVFAGAQRGTEFVTAYVIEESLSVDNIFVFVLLFGFFAVPSSAQHRVLFYGVLGAQVFRGLFIAAGVKLIERFEFTIFVFGAFLVVSGLRLLRSDGDAVDVENNRTLRFVRRFVPMADDYDGDKMFTVRDGRRIATPLIAVLAVIEVTDLVFAVDSIPAVLSISSDTFIVFTSNILAILGLRSLYFLLADVVTKFHLLRIGLAATLTFVGVKMLLSHWVHIPTLVSLAVVATCIGASVWASLRWPAPDAT